MASSPTTVLWISDSKKDIMLDRNMKKRKLSNRESARRSRIRKQNHVQELVYEFDQLQKQKQQLEANLSLTKQLCMNMEAEASVMQTQMAELRYQLAFLNEFSLYTMSINPVYNVEHQSEYYLQTSSFIMDPWNNPISASADIFM